MRTLDSYQKKLERAFRPLPVENVKHIVYASRMGIQSETYFTYKGANLRFDYCLKWDERLPRLGELREMIWENVEGLAHDLKEGLRPKVY